METSKKIAEPPPLLVRLEEGARRLNVSRSHLYKLEAQGQVRFTRVGSSVRISEAELQRIARGEPLVSRA